MSCVRYEVCEIDPGHYIKVLKCHSDENVKTETVNKNLFIIIPGNPGVIEFYEHFAIELNKKTNSPVVGISHTGHLYHETIDEWKPKNVMNQIMDKIKFIEKHLGDEYQYDNIIFIGHSVGCYVILELLELLNNQHKLKVKKSFLLFPTIERMSLSPNGKVLTFASKFFGWFVYFLAFLISCLPELVQKKLVQLGFTSRHPPSEENVLIDNIDDIVFNMGTNYSCVKSCFYMGSDEMNVVKELNKKCVKNNLDKLYFYYGANDKWCPIDYYHDMRKHLEQFENKCEINVHLDEHGLEHAFVIFKKQCEIIIDKIHNHLNAA